MLKELSSLLGTSEDQVANDCLFLAFVFFVLFVIALICVIDARSKVRP